MNSPASAMSREEKLALLSRLASEKAKKPKRAPLSFAQERHYFLTRLDPESYAHTIFRAFTISGPFETSAFEAALGDLLRRHESLRATFVEVDGNLSQLVAPPASADEFRLDIEDLSRQPDPEELSRLKAEEEARRPFDLSQDSPVRWRILRVAEDRWVFLLSLHHIIADGWSLGILLRELWTAYGARVRGEAPSFAPLPIQFSDFAQWQHEKLDLASQIAFWKGALDGAPTVLELATDFPRPALASLAGDYVHFDFDPATSRGLRQLARENGASTFMVLLSVFAVLLHRCTGQNDLLLGTPIANRHRQEVEGLIGSFANTLVLRSQFQGPRSFVEHLAVIRRHSLEAFEHQDLPFERLVEEMHPHRDLSRNPLFQVMFALLEARGGGMAAQAPAQGLTVEPKGVTRSLSKVDITLEMADDGENLGGYFEYSTDLYQRSSIERLAATFAFFAERILENPRSPLERLPLIDPQSRQLQLEQWNATSADFDLEVPLPNLILERARQNPSAVAVIEAPAYLAASAAKEKGRSLTYGELGAASARLAAQLRAQGIRRGDRVGLCLERSLEATIAFLAVWRAGAAYVPLDPGYPQGRLAYMIEDSGLSILLTQEKLLERLPQGQAPVLTLDELTLDELTVDELLATDPGGSFEDLPLGGDDLAYIIYTSGSTGRPKGVLVPHRGLKNHALAIVEHYELQASDRVLQFASLSFDLAGEEIYPTWVAGATLVLRSEQQSLGLADFMLLLRKQGISVANLPTPYWHEWVIELQEGHHLPPTDLRLVIVGTEQALAERLEGWLKAVGERPRWLNSYGPSEATITTTSWDPGAPGELAEREKVGRVAIGRPIRNIRAYVLDAGLEPLPLGLPGQLCLAGAGLAHGYHQRPALSAEKFVPDPFSGIAGARMYLTGDKARFLPSGTLEFLGRLDNQVKVRGFRIELGEIEAFLADHPSVADCVVLARQVAAADLRLVAFVAPTGAASPRLEQELRQHLEARLPAYMVPSALQILPSLPMNRSGKVDREALRSMPLAEQNLDDAPWEAPRDPIEEVLAEIWSSLLGGQRIGVHDDFFRLGGHSLLAIRMLSRLHAVLGVELPLKDVFSASTLEALARRIALARSAGKKIAPPIFARPGGEKPLSFAQQRMWFLAQLDPQSPAYNMPNAMRLRGEIDVPLLERCLSEIVRRHETLRTTFTSEHGKPRQVVHQAHPLKLELIEATDEKEAHNLSRDLSLRPFDLEKDLPFRCQLIRIAPDLHWLALVFHHIASDGWSTDLFLHELEVLYQAFMSQLPSPLAELPLQYSDFAAWQNDTLAGEALEAQLAFWREALKGSPGLLALPLDRPRPMVRQHLGGRAHFEINAELSNRFRELGRENGCSLFMTFLAAWGAFLGRITGQQDIAIGTPVAGRHRPEIERLVGFFANTLVLRLAQVIEPTFAELLAATRRSVLDAYDHQDLPFEKLVDEIQPQRATSHTPIFQVTFALHHTSTFHHDGPAGQAKTSGNNLQWSLPSIDNETARFDLALVLVEMSQGFRGFFEYDRDLFDRATIERLVAAFETLLAAIAAGPKRQIAQLDLLPQNELRLLEGARFPGEAAAQPSLPPLALPLDQKRPRVLGTSRVSQRIDLNPELSESLRVVCERAQAGLEEVLLASLATLLHRWTSQTSFGIGTPQRGQGYAVACDLEGRPSFEALVGRLRQACADAFPASCEAFFELREAEDLEPAEAPSAGELWVVATKRLKDLSIELFYSPDLFSDQTVERLGQGWLALLEAVCRNERMTIDRLPVMGEKDLGRLAATCVPPLPLLGDSMLGPIDLVAQQRPEAKAIAFGAQVLTYAELIAEVDQLAAHLVARGVVAGQLVGILIERSLELPIALLAVLRTGAAYLPLDPAFPRERLDLMLEISGAELVLEHRGLFAQLGLQHQVELYDLDAPREHIALPSFTLAPPESLAYVLFTSGSTGRPKGVMISQRALANFIASLARVPGCGPSDVFVSVTTISFDIFGLEFYLPLQCGALVVLADRETSADPWRLSELLEASQATLFQATPATWRSVLDSGWQGQKGLTAFSGGEALLLELAERICDKVGSLWNIYGPTETTIYSSLRPVEKDQVAESGETFVSLGEPVSATTLHVVDRYGNLVPPGVIGELWIGGEGLAYGYLGQPGLTAERFLPNGFSSQAGERVYRTGDLVRRRAGDLRIDFLGRLDHQVKIRGYRIELGEIEGLLERQPSIAQAAVVVRGEGAALRLEAFVVRQKGASGDAAAWREALLERLPSYMMPSLFIELPAFPLTPNGKVDRKALVAPKAGDDAQAFARRELEQGLHHALGSSPAGLPVVILDAHLQRLPIGVQGEVCLALEGLPEDQVASSPSMKDGRPIYRSGRLGRLVAGNGEELELELELKAEETEATTTASSYVEPRNDVESRIAEIWQNVLSLEKVSATADFFELGGHSLLATQVMARLRETFNIDLPLRLLFERKTIAGLAEEIVAREVLDADEDLLRRLLEDL